MEAYILYSNRIDPNTENNFIPTTHNNCQILTRGNNSEMLNDNITISFNISIRAFALNTFIIYTNIMLYKYEVA